ncbi:MAG: outer membrane channel protein TolC [Litorilituus sp.]|jgi:outer membrane protein|nr:outer membrane channel protein TolC [Litorilituus sp.]
MKKTLSTLIIAITGAVTSVSAQADDLLSVYQQALQNDTTVQKAYAQFKIVEEDISQSRSALLPQLSAYGRFSDGERENIETSTGNIVTTDYDSLSYGANLNMQLYHHDSWLQLDTAEKAAHQSDLIYQVAKQDLIVRVTQAYFAILSAKDDLEFAKAEKTAIARQLEQTKQRFSVGLTVITDMHEAQAQYDNAVTAEIQAENAIYKAEEELRVITNIYPSNMFVLNTDRFSTTAPSPSSADEWQNVAESKNLNLLAAKVSIDIAKQNIKAAKAGHYPTLDFGARYESTDTDSGNINTPALDNYSVGVTLNVPIYAGGAIESSVRQAQNRYVSANQELMQSHRSVVRTTRNAYNTVVATISSIKALEQSVLSAEKALEATEAGFEVGTRTIVDVLNSTRNLYNAKRNLSSTRYAYIQNVLLLKRAGGTITDEDITAINSGLMAAK